MHILGFAAAQLLWGFLLCGTNGCPRSRLRAEVPSWHQCSAKSRFRLVADPGISVSQIQQGINAFLTHKRTPDLWSLMAPPPGGPLRVDWRTPVQGDWLTRTSGLLHELIQVAPDNKLQSQKAHKALSALHQNKQPRTPQTSSPRSHPRSRRRPPTRTRTKSSKWSRRS